MAWLLMEHHAWKISLKQRKEVKKQTKQQLRKKRTHTNVCLKKNKQTNKLCTPAVRRHALVAAVLFVPVLAVHGRVVATTSHAHARFCCILTNRFTREMLKKKTAAWKHFAFPVWKREKNAHGSDGQQRLHWTKVILISTFAGFYKWASVRLLFLRYYVWYFGHVALSNFYY